jgi:VCBS repeat-containing protein
MPNIAPDVDLNGAAAGNGASLSYTEGDAPTAIAPDATALDADSADLDQGSLTVAFTAGGTADDQLRIVGGDFVVEEIDLYYLDVLIGTVAGGTDGWTPLVIQFNADATPAIAAALIRAIGFVNFSATPVAGNRTVAFTLADGDGGTSVARTATVTVTAVDTPPVAQDDGIGTNENAIGTGSLFADNGNGNDFDPDGPSLTISEVNGSSANVGTVITLDSGAKLTVNANGTYSYDPNGRFDYLTDANSGAVNTSTVGDTFTYTLAGGGTATVTVSVYGVAGPGDRLMGDWDDNSITGTSGADTFLLQQGGLDTASGLGGDDIFYFGGALQALTTVSGGSGDDTILLQGDYSGGLVLGTNVTGIESISMLAGSNTAFGAPGTDLNSYVITTHDSNFAAGVRVKVNGSVLLAGENLTFDGSAETDASFLIYGGRGTDQLTGGTGNDIFFYASDRFAPGDSLVGGQGYDALFLYGAYTIDFGSLDYAGALTGIESIGLSSDTDERYARGGSGHAYDLTLGDGLVGAGGTLTVNGAMLQSYETMKVDGSGETNGLLRLFGGSAADILLAGAGADLIYGGGGADAIAGGGGADTIRYDLASESTASATDSIAGFQSGTDKFDLTRIDADSNAAGNQAFTWIGSSAFGNVAGQLRAFQSGGNWIVQGDTDGNGVADLVITVVAPAAPLVQGDFLL